MTIDLGDLDYEIHCLSWENSNERILQAHKTVLEHFKIPVKYTIRTIPHGLWMDEMFNNSETEIIGFLDSDCVPTNKEIVSKAINYTIKNKSFIGISQVSNHINPRTHVYAAPAFFFMHRDCWNSLGRTSCIETRRSDVAEEISHIAEERGKTYRCLYPTHLERAPQGGLWRLNNYSYYGIGTHFQGGIYHLYQGRFSENIELFEKRCKEIVDGSFSTEHMMDVHDIDF